MAGKRTGVVFSFNDKEGFGFIKPDDGGAYLFVHDFEIWSEGGCGRLQEGQKVEFAVGGQGDRMVALDVSGPNGSPLPPACRDVYGDDDHRRGGGGYGFRGSGGYYGRVGCFKCGEFGHFAKHCSMIGGNGGGGGGGGGGHELNDASDDDEVTLAPPMDQAKALEAQLKLLMFVDDDEVTLAPPMDQAKALEAQLQFVESQMRRIRENFAAFKAQRRTLILALSRQKSGATTSVVEGASTSSDLSESSQD